MPALAGSRNNLANMQSAAGNRVEALRTAEEAVKYYRELALRSRDAFLPDLAGSLKNMANLKSEAAKREEAIGAEDEALKMRRELARLNRDAFLPDLALSLGALSQVHSASGTWSRSRLPQGSTRSHRPNVLRVSFRLQVVDSSNLKRLPRSLRTKFPSSRPISPRPHRRQTPSPIEKGPLPAQAAPSKPQLNQAALRTGMNPSTLATCKFEMTPIFWSSHNCIYVTSSSYQARP